MTVPLASWQSLDQLLAFISLSQKHGRNPFRRRRFLSLGLELPSWTSVFKAIYWNNSSKPCHLLRKKTMGWNKIITSFFLSLPQVMEKHFLPLVMSFEQFWQNGRGIRNIFMFNYSTFQVFIFVFTCIDRGAGGSHQSDSSVTVNITLLGSASLITSSSACIFQV